MMDLEKVNLSPIRAIAHDGTLKILIECEGNYRIESLPAPEQAFRGIQQLARFAALIQEDTDLGTTREQLLDEIEMIRVDSSTVSAIGYSDAFKTLQVDYVAGSRYRYFEVPSQVFTGFLEAPSKGQYLNAAIKAENYEYQEVC